MNPSATLIAVLAVTVLSACSQQPPDVNPNPPVPPPVAEVTPKPPVATEPLVWQPGHWDWIGNVYVWAPGQYVPATGHGNLWMPGWWSRTETGWTWQPAHWTS